MTCPAPTIRGRLFDVVLAVCALLSGGIAITTQINVEAPVTPEPVRNGWRAPDPAELATAEPFVLQTAGAYESTEGAVVKLWDYSRAINGGQHFPTFLQQVGDCVANGAANAVNYLQAVQLARGPPVAGAFEFRPAHRCFIYGASRTHPEIGNKRLGSSDGSVGAWAAEAVQTQGVLAQEDGPDYSGQLAREWGSRGVPDAYYWQAALFKVRSVARVTTYEQLRDALASGYPVTCAGNVGFKMQPVVRDGKHWGVPSGSWAHQMCWLAVDDTARSPFDGQVGAVYTLNSWGPNAHGQPADDAPPGGFWIDRTTAERYLRQGDCWAFSAFDGFPQRDLDFQIFRDREPIDVQFVAGDPAPLVPVCERFAHVSADDALCGGSCCGALALLGIAHRRRRRVRRQLAAHRVQSA